MAKKPKLLNELSADQLMEMVDERVAMSLPPIAGPTPTWPPNWPPVWPPCPWPPYGPIYRNSGEFTGAGSVFEPGFQRSPGVPTSSTQAGRGAASTIAIVTQDQIDSELLKAMKSWKPRFSYVTVKTKIADLTASGNGRFDIISAVDRSRFFRALGVNLFPFHIAGDATLGEAAETLATLIEDQGHVVAS